MIVIEHSGMTFVTSRRGPNGHPIWPIDEMFVRRKFSRKVEARIRKLHPEGKEEGSIIRGWHPHRRSREYWTDYIGRGEVIRRYGRKVLAKLHRSNANGKRGAFSRLELFQVTQL